MKQEYRDLCEEQVRELFRLSAEAEACSQLLRQEAERYRSMLDDGTLTEESLRDMAAHRESLRIAPEKLVRVTEGLM